MAEELESPLDGILSPLGGDDVEVALAAPSNVVLPYITGTPTVGQTLYGNPGIWTGFPYPTFSYQWRRNGLNISGETSQTYVVQLADVGQDITVYVTGTNSQGSASASSTAVVGEASGAPAYAQEDGFAILLENGSRLLVE